MNSFKLFGLKRKLDIFCPVEDFFELHSSATEGKKDRAERKENSRWLFLVKEPDGAQAVKKGNFLAN